jgi:glycosyltransferase involved in cell wall biosynthesis
MTILYLHQYFNTPLMPGSTRSYEFAKRLVDRGDTVHMVTTNWNGKSNKSFSIESGINVYWAPIRYSNKMKFIRRIISYFSYIWFVNIIVKKLKYDLIIASSTPLTVAIPAIWLKKIKKVKLVLEIRDLWPQLPIAIGILKSSILIKMARILEKKAYLVADKIILLSSGMKSELKGSVPSQKLSVITNISDIKHFNVSPSKGLNFRKSILITDKDPLVVYTGALGRINGLSYMVRIANKMKRINSNVKFLLVGEGFEKKEIELESKKLNLFNKQIFFLDYIPKSEMPNVLSAATITTSFFINLPEMENNSANKFFDSLAAGKPIMINYGGWQSKLLKSNNAGFIIPNNNASKAAKILNDVLTNESLLIRMEEASKKLALHFDINTNYKKFANVIDQAFHS